MENEAHLVPLIHPCKVQHSILWYSDLTYLSINTNYGFLANITKQQIVIADMKSTT